MRARLAAGLLAALLLASPTLVLGASDDAARSVRAEPLEDASLSEPARHAPAPLAHLAPQAAPALVVGEPATLRALVRHDGGAAFAIMRVALSVDGREVGALRVVGLEAGEAREVAITFSPTRCGGAGLAWSLLGEDGELLQHASLGAQVAPGALPGQPDAPEARLDAAGDVLLTMPAPHCEAPRVSAHRVLRLDPGAASWAWIGDTTGATFTDERAPTGELRYKVVAVADALASVDSPAVTLVRAEP